MEFLMTVFMIVLTLCFIVMAVAGTAILLKEVVELWNDGW